MAGDRGTARADAKPFILPMALCFALGMLFGLAILGLNIYPEQRYGIRLIAQAPAIPPFYSHRGQAAEIGAFLAYRGHAALALSIALAVIALALVALWSFVRDSSLRFLLGGMLAAQMALSAVLAIGGGAPMKAIARRLTCPPHDALSQEPLEAWQFCAQPAGLPVLPHFTVDYSLNGMINALCSAATCAVVYAIFVVARAESPRALPRIVGSSERCITALLVAASALLVAVMLRDGSFLRWAFAGPLAAKDPPGDIIAYVSGTVTFNGALGTILLGSTWFVALLLNGLRRGEGGETHPDASADSGGFSAYNASAIFAPVVSAIASNLLSGL